jgi:putative heme-binding domain-containing protein
MHAALLLLAAMPTAVPATPEVTVPPGFAITQYADNTLAPDITTMTIDEAGRVLAAGRGYVRVLVDDNGDGVADRAIDLIDGLKDSPMGLLAEGDSLYVVAGAGLTRYRGYNGKDRLAGPPELLVKLKAIGEHDAHMVRRGPDGWLYLLCGNSAGVKKETITGARSPVKQPVAGALLRISPDGKEVEVVADGFRNPYSFDFDLEGEPFTYDSDNERCVGLPWYEPCRFYHVVPGGNHGWRSPQLGQFWRKPPYFIDCVPPVCYLGRGSPTGVACYRHTHFPQQYRGGFFLADWTFGRIHFVPLQAQGSGYTGKPTVFAAASGTSGFAVTGLSVHPVSGELFASIGGRGTRGGVYRITHTGSPAGSPLPMAKRSLEWSEGDARKWLEAAESKGFFQELLPNPSGQRGRRQALELMLRRREKMPWGQSLFDALAPHLESPDRLIRLAAGRAAVGMAIPEKSITGSRARLTLAYCDVAKDRDWALGIALSALAGKSTDEEKLEALRIIHLLHGDLTSQGANGNVFEGYTFRNALSPARDLQIYEACLEELKKPCTPELETEVFRALAALRESVPYQGGSTPLVVAMKRLRESPRVQDKMRYISFMAAFEARELVQFHQELLSELLSLEGLATSQQVVRDRNWSLRFEEVVAALGSKKIGLESHILRNREFGQPEHLPFVKGLGMDPKVAANKFLAQARTDPTYRWTPGVVELIGHLPEEKYRPVVLELWEQPGLQDAIIRVLSRNPSKDDLPRYLVGLGSFDPAIVQLAAETLSKFPAPADASDLVKAIRALRRLSSEDRLPRAAVGALLQKWTGQSLPADARAWGDWLAGSHPAAAKQLASNDGFDAAAWKKREMGIAWEKGDAGRGRQVFSKASCAACHDGGRALGPSLLGVSKRFSKDDLLTAILQPSKDVSPRYRPTRITTTDEKVYVGMIVYEATDGVILQTNADTTLRIEGEKIVSSRPVELSMMPAGLLDKLADPEVADLFAYLRSLDDGKPR